MQTCPLALVQNHPVCDGKYTSTMVRSFGIGKSMTIPRDKVKPMVKPIQGTTHLGLWHPPIPEKKYNLLPEIGSTWTWVRKTFTLVNMRTIAGTEWSMLDVDLPHFKTSWDLISILNRLG